MTDDRDKSTLQDELRWLHKELETAHRELREQAEQLGRAQATAEALRADLDRLRQESEPRDQPAALAIEPQEAPTEVLVQDLRSVFDRMAVAEPAAGQQHAVALTGFEVEARGVLLPPSDKTGQTRLLTVDPATVSSEALSTVKMRFGLVPRVPPGG
jgi:hypothetical protein